jgi:probable HAF family extracellular repeat protein
MRDLGTLGGNKSGAWGVNNHRQVVGYSSVPGNDNVFHAFLWTSASGLQDLGTLGGSSSYALAINDSGAIVGTSNLPGDTVQHAFLWTKSKGMQDLETLGGRNSTAFGINSEGWVVGISDTRKPAQGAVFLWRNGKGLENLTKQISSSSGWLVDNLLSINKAGQIAGYGFSPDDRNDFRAVLLTPIKSPAD